MGNAMMLWEETPSQTARRRSLVSPHMNPQTFLTPTPPGSVVVIQVIAVTSFSVVKKLTRCWVAFDENLCPTRNRSESLVTVGYQPEIAEGERIVLVVQDSVECQRVLGKSLK